MRRRDRFYAWLRARPLVPDAVVACGLFLLLVVPSALTFEPGWPHLAIGVAMYGALVVRRVFPVVSFAGVAGTGLVQWAVGLDLTAADVAILIALYSISAYGPRWASRLGLVSGVVGAVLASQRYVMAQGGTAASVVAVGLLGAAVVGVWALGDVRRIRQAYVTELVERAKQAERERDQQARIAADERARIAREMHDVVAHNLSVIVAQADGGRYAAESDPSRAAGVLDTISSTGRSALAEMRRLLGILRSGDDQGEARVPQPDLAEFSELVASFERAGLPVAVEVEGETRSIAGGPSLAMYRAVQEALTNVLKHAGQGARATVRLVYDDDKIEAHVTDDGTAPAAGTPSHSGHGLAGMRERLALYGADVTAGPDPDGGWQVAVTMPTDEEGA